MNKILVKCIMSFVIIFFRFLPSIMARNTYDVVSENNSEYASFVIFFSIIVVFFVFLLWTIWGKDKVINGTLEVYPPENYNSAEIGFFYNGIANDKVIISLLLYLLNKGYLKIEKNDLGEFILTKLKDYDNDNNFERTFLEGLFKKSSDIVMGRDFYNKINRKKDYITLITELKREYKKFKEQDDITVKNRFELKEYVTFSELYNNFFSTINKLKRKYNTKTTKKIIFKEHSINISYMIIFFMITIFLLITVKPLILGGAERILLWVWFSGFGLIIVLRGIFDAFLKLDNISGMKSIKNPLIRSFVIILIGGIFGGIPWLFEVRPYLLMEDGYIEMYKIGIVSIVILMLFYCIMPQRTIYGNKLLARIEGFKIFLEEVEKNQLENIIIDNQNYFYEMLPYAYALNVFDIWMEKFEWIDIKPPEWYCFNENFNVRSFRIFMNDMMKEVENVFLSQPS